jgi:hypothetical protein
MRKIVGVIIGVLSIVGLMLSGPPRLVQAQGPVTPPPPPPQPTVIPLDGYEQAASSANAQAQAASGKLAAAQAEYAQAQQLAAQANAKLAEAKQARDRQLLEQSVTLATQAKDLADQATAKIAAADRLMGDAQALIASQSAANVALQSDLKALGVELAGVREQLSAAQLNAQDLRGQNLSLTQQMTRQTQQMNTWLVMLSFSLIIAAIMAFVMLRRTAQLQHMLQTAATVQTPTAVPASATNPAAAATVVDETGTILYEEPDADEELSVMLANVFSNPAPRPGPAPSVA